MVRLTLKQCAYFLAVADHGGIAQAARALNISQPAVAQALDKLEALCGLSLFVRHHARGADLTLQGRAFARSARALLREAEHAERDARAIAANLAGTLRFGCFHTIAPFCLTRIIAAHRAAFPGVEVLSGELLQDEILAGLERAELDLALTYDMGLEGRPLARQAVARLKPFILLGADHPLAGRSSIALSELAEMPFVMFDQPASRDYFASVLATQGIAPPIAFNGRSMESVRGAVAGGLGFSLSVMRPRTAETYDGGRVAHVPIAGRVAPLAVVLIHHAEKTPSPLLDNFVETCKSAF